MERLFDVGKEWLGGENVKAGVDLAKLSLGGAGGFFFDDGEDFGATDVLTRILADDAAVSRWVVEVGGEQRSWRPAL